MFLSLHFSQMQIGDILGPSGAARCICPHGDSFALSREIVLKAKDYLMSSAPHKSLLPDRTPEPAHSPPLGWVIIALSFATLISQLGATIANVGLPTLMHVFGVGFGEVQWVVLSYLLAVVALAVSVGRLGDIVGRKRLYLIGLACFTIASIGCGAAPTLDLLIAARAVQGLGAAVIMALTLAFVSEAVPKARAGMAMGVLGTLQSLATTLAPSFGGLLISTLGWRFLFLSSVPLGIIAFAASWRYLPEGTTLSGKRDRKEFDYVGTVILVATLATYSLAMTFAQTEGFANRRVLTLLAFVAVGVCLFVITEMRVRDPLVKLSMFGDVLLSASLIMNVLVVAVMMSTLILGPFFLSRAIGLSTRDVGFIMSIGPMVAAFAGMPAGWLVDRFGTRETMIAGLTIFTGGAFLMSMVSCENGPLAYILPIVVISVGYPLFQTPNNTAVMANVSSDQRGIVSGLLNLSRVLGLITGASLMGALFASAVGGSKNSKLIEVVAGASPDAISTGMQITYGIATTMGLAAMAMAAMTLFARLSPLKYKEN
jgi:EmrB/QacA subfamily drug resistance transporter